jgi:hypothetical protein
MTTGEENDFQYLFFQPYQRLSQKEKEIVLKSISEKDYQNLYLLLRNGKEKFDKEEQDLRVDIFVKNNLDKAFKQKYKNKSSIDLSFKELLQNAWLKTTVAGVACFLAIVFILNNFIFKPHQTVETKRSNGDSQFPTDVPKHQGIEQGDEIAGRNTYKIESVSKSVDFESPFKNKSSTEKETKTTVAPVIEKVDSKSVTGNLQELEFYTSTPEEAINSRIIIPSSEAEESSFYLSHLDPPGMNENVLTPNENDEE